MRRKQGHITVAILLWRGFVSSYAFISSYWFQCFILGIIIKYCHDLLCHLELFSRFGLWEPVQVGFSVLLTRLVSFSSAIPSYEMLWASLMSPVLAPASHKMFKKIECAKHKVLFHRIELILGCVSGKIVTAQANITSGIYFAFWGLLCFPGSQCDFFFPSSLTHTVIMSADAAQQ